MPFKAAKPLRWHISHKPLLGHILVVALGTLVLFLAVRGAVHHMGEVRAWELARSIDNIALVAPTPTHLQQVVEDAVKARTATRVTVVDKASRRVIATGHPHHLGRTLQGIDDPHVAEMIKAALTSGIFRSHRSGWGNRVLVFPLTSARHLLAGNFVRDQAEWLKPGWHNDRSDLPGSMWDALKLLSQTVTGYEDGRFTVPGNDFSGIIAIELNQTTADLLFDAAIVFILSVQALVVLALLTISYWTNYRYITRPMERLTGFIERLRDGGRHLRAKREGIAEFDRLAVHLNGLLDMREHSEQHGRVLSKVLEAAPFGIEVANADHILEYASPAYQRMTGHKLLEIVGKTPMQLHGCDRSAPETLRAAESAVADGKSWHGEVWCRRKSGEEFCCELTVCPILDERGRLERILAVRHDITEHKAREQELIDARREAEAGERAKSEFIAKMSHELRTPLNSIIGFSQMIAQGNLGPINPQYGEFARLIESSATGLLGVINSIIDLSRLDGAAGALDETVFSPGAVVERLMGRLTEEAAQHRIGLHLQDLAPYVSLRADETKFRTLVTALLANAIKFNRPGGRVDVTIRRDYRKRLVVEVADTGIGIPDDQLPHVIEAFYQGEAGHDRSYGGVGLGLTLAAQIARAHGGEVQLSSPKRRGTKVKVLFPPQRTVVHPARRRRIVRRRYARSVA